MLDHGQAPPLLQEPRKPVNPLLRRKPVERLVSEGGQGEGGVLRRSLTMWQLTMISIGATAKQLRRTVPVHPTVSELLPTLVSELRPA